MSDSQWNVDEWFSTKGQARRWDDMYVVDDPKPSENNFRLRRDYAVDFVKREVPGGGRVLDLGCGAGIVLTELVREGYVAIGLDYASDMLQSARRRLQEQESDAGVLLRGDAGRLPFPDESFDGLVCLGVISYQPDYTDMLTEIRRVLVPGAAALITFRNVFHKVVSDPWEVCKAMGRYVLRRERPYDVGMGRSLDPAAVRGDLEKAGFDCERFEGIGLGPVRIAGRQLLSDRLSIRMDRATSKALRGVGLSAVESWSADVAMFSCRKPEPRGRAS